MYDSESLSDSVSEVSSYDPNVWCSPNAGAYAVVRINAIEMVRHLHDAAALDAAKLMQTKSYLVCLDRDVNMHYPGQPWYRYEAQPIGPHLPPANDAKGYTSEMCIPIFPNSSHPTGREPVHPEPPLPYGNCYHWIDSNILIRVRARSEGFDETNVVRISPRKRSVMERLFTSDHSRARESVEAAQKSLHDIVYSGTDSPQNIHPSARRSQRSSFDAASGRSSRLSACYRSFECSSSGSDEDLTDTYEGVTDANDDLALTPLFDLWLDLIDNLKEEDIPSPLELQQEIEAIQGIIRESRLRAYAAWNTLGSSSSSLSEDEMHESRTSQSTPLDRRWVRLSTMCRKLCAPARQLALKIKRRVHVPYIRAKP